MGSLMLSSVIWISKKVLKKEGFACIQSLLSTVHTPSHREILKFAIKLMQTVKMSNPQRLKFSVERLIIMIVDVPVFLKKQAV